MTDIKKKEADKSEDEIKKETEDKSVGIKVEKSKKEPKQEKEKEKENITIDLDEEMNDKTPKKESTKKEDLLEDLPESVKKKLEQAKTDKKSKKKRVKKKKEKKNISVGKAYVKATYNNTIVTLTDLEGNVISWASAGVAGFKGPKKSTSYAGQIITRIAVQKAREAGLEEVSVYVRGVGTGRESAVRALNSAGLTIMSIQDITPIPHNGCRSKKPRRV